MELACRTDAVLDSWTGRIAGVGVKVHRVDLRQPGEYRDMWRLIRGSDVVHLLIAFPAGRYQLAVALLAAAAHRPLVATHQLAVDIRDMALPGWRRALWQACFRLYSRAASWNIASSKAGWDLLVHRYGFSETSTELIYNGADLERFKPILGTARNDAREALAASVGASGWPLDMLLVVTVARLTPQKGLNDLVDAAARVSAKLPRARFVLVGDGVLGESLARQVADRQLADHFRLAGGRSLEEIATWLGAVDLFVLSSLDEGMPLALLEAMAAGCPVVATAVGGIPDVVDGQGVGRLVPAADVPALASAIEQVLADEGGRRVMAAAARRRVMETFDVDTCHRRTAALYGKVA